MGHYRRFADHLVENQSCIIRMWAEYSKGERAILSARSLTHCEFKDGIPEVLETMVKMLRSRNGKVSSAATTRAVKEHGYDRWRQGFDLPELLLDWGNLQEVVILLAHRFFNEEEHAYSISDQADILASLIRFFNEAMCASAQRFDEARQQDASSVSAKLNEMKSHFEKLYDTRTGYLRQASHDMRGGLMAISCASTLLKENGGRKNQVPLDLGSIIDDSVNSVMEILDSLLNLNRLDVGDELLDVKELDASELLRSLAHSLKQPATAKGLLLRIEGPETAPIEGDFLKIRRIAQNLLINAIKYTESGSVSMQWKLNKKTWSLLISDTGPGLHYSKKARRASAEKDDNSSTASLRSQLMNEEGDGIGLIIVRRLCTLLNAQIKLTTAKDKGTSFLIQFPREYREEHKSLSESVQVKPELCAIS